ncbi:DUF1002 domain-containing protein [Blautia sp. MSK.20.9]|uniref:DUF1002 domain-containing protein n=1 Tax=Blautia sp. MSK20_18 TaxID=2883186 RepID=UPI00156FAE55|nr:DUF1002 domain-containing protein [Blautia sp. MSK20_18]MCB7508306.1 DUF1002 domain-containing protein [Blautia sp. MSK20_18]NSK11461.1 DUF1002 domain-containing protein [Blautia sp. MSK.20.9]
MKNKNRFLAILCSALMATASLPAVALQPVMADASKVVSIGNDLTDAQKKTMMKYFGISGDKSVQQITVTNKDEVSHLSGYIPLEQIGTRTVSCAYIKPTESGGIKVRTANLQYVTANMIASTLADLGIKNCEVVSACPFQVSGTGALTGVMMAYEKATGTVINKDKKDIATQEVVITKDIAKDIGTAQAENIVNQAKTEVVQNNVTNKTDIQNTVTNIINNNNVNITEQQIDNIVDLVEDVANQDYDDSYVKNLEEIGNNIKQELEAIKNDKKEDTDKSDKQEEKKETKDSDSITDQVDDSVLGDNVISSSTDDPEMIVNTTEDDMSDIDNAAVIEDDMDEDSSGTGTDDSSSDDSLSSTDVSDEQGDDEMTPVTEDTYEEQTEGSEDISKEDSVEPTQEDTDNADTTDETVNTEKDKKDKSVSIFGYDLSEITKNAGEEASKGFSKIEKYLKEHFAFNEESNDDKDANVENPNTDEKISNVAKTLLDAYYDALAAEKDSAASGNEDANESTGEDAETEKTEQASEAFLNKVKELLNDGKISEDDAKKLEKEFAKTDTEDGDIEDEITESDAGNGSSKGDGTETVTAE